MSLNLDKTAWERVRFGDVVRNVNETTRDPESLGIDRVVAMEHLDPGELTVTRWGSTDDGTTFTRRVRTGQTLFGKRRAYQRKVAHADFDAICSGDILTFEADPDRLLPRLLPFVVQSDPFFDHALGTSAGSLSPRTNWRDLADFEFDLPPLDEQQRIAHLLWAVESHRASLHQLEGATRQAGRSYILTLETGTPASKPVAAVASVKNGQAFPKKLQGRASGDIPFFKVADLDRPGNERFLTNPGNWISIDDLRSLGIAPYPAGTIVTARVGAAIRLERRRALASPGLVDENHLVISPERVDPRYLLAVLSERRFAKSGNDGVVPSLNQQIVGSMEIPSLDECQEAYVADIYHGVMDSRDLVARESRSLKVLRSSLLRQIVGGRL